MRFAPQRKVAAGCYVRLVTDARQLGDISVTSISLRDFVGARAPARIKTPE